MVSEIQSGQTFSRHPPAHPDTMGENNTPTALKGCVVETYFCDICHYFIWQRIPANCAFLFFEKVSSVANFAVHTLSTYYTSASTSLIVVSFILSDIELPRITNLKGGLSQQISQYKQSDNMTYYTSAPSSLAVCTKYSMVLD